MKELLRDVKCKGSYFSGSSRRNPYLHLNLCGELERKMGLIRYADQNWVLLTSCAIENSLGLITSLGPDNIAIRQVKGGSRWERSTGRECCSAA
jgi:hypothetical protein